MRRGASNRQGAWAIWIVAAVGYAVAVFHRTSFGVAALEAQDRLDVSASGVSLVSVLQIAVYAGMQVPAGALLDRFGSRRVLVTAALVMAAGQVTMALASSLSLALTARVLLGMGDAMTFVSVLRLITLWFPAPRVSLVTQLTGVVGQLGQIVSAYPLVTLLGSVGWTASFLVISAAGLGVGGLIASVVHEPRFAPLPETAAALRTAATVSAAWREPGTRLGLWAHFVTLFPGTAFGMLWGYPFLVEAQHRSPETAGLLLCVMVAGGILTAPVLGIMVGRRPSCRSVLVLFIVAFSAVAWTAVLAWPGPAPLSLLTLLMLALATNGPGSVIAFDYGRTHNPPARVGTASGIINVGGFVATLVTVLAIGLVLQAMSPGDTGEYTLSAFRAAFCAQYVVWTLGLFWVLKQLAIVRRLQLRSTDAVELGTEACRVGLTSGTASKSAQGDRRRDGRRSTDSRP